MFSTLSVNSFLMFGLASCTLVNVARDKTVTMSSYYDDSLPPGSEPQAPGSYAVNGINDGQWYTGSCACTKNEQGPWLLLDLESSYTVVAMQIVNRADCCPERLRNLNFTFGPSEENMAEIYYHEGTVGVVLDITFDMPHTGQFLRIKMDSYNYLTLCEVEVYEIGEPVNGGWTGWGNWTTCSPTCDNGTESRSRSCTNPAPRYGGEDCDGDAVETRACEVPECPDFQSQQDNGSVLMKSCVQRNPVDGGWTNFSNWSACSHSCGIGISTRTRSCTNPTPSGGGQDCVGASTESVVCNTEECPPVEETNNIDLCEPNEFPENCEDIRLSNPAAASGVYFIYPLYSEVELEVFCEFLDDKSYLYLSRSAIELITTAELRLLYSRRDHVLIRLLYAGNVQSSLEVSQLSSFQYQYALSFQISSFERHSRPLNYDVSSYLYVGFQPSEAAPFTDPAKLLQNPFFGYRANGVDVLFKNVDQRPKSFVAFFPDHDAFISSQYYTGWSEEMPTAIPWSPWFVYTQAVPTSRYLPPEYFMDYELGFGGSNGSANSNDGEILRGRLGATVGFAYDYRQGCEVPLLPLDD